MDTKLKNNDKSILVTLITILLIFIMALGMVMLYPSVKKISGEDITKINVYEDNQIKSTLNKTSYVLYKNLMEKESEIKPDVADLYIKSFKNQEKDKAYYYSIDLQRKLNEWKMDLNAMKNLDYYIANNNVEKEDSNNDKLKKIINKGSLSTEEAKDIYSYYDFYVVIKYDENGNTSINDIKGAKKEILDNEFNNKQIYYSNNTQIYLDKPQNITIAYGIPKNLQYNDLIKSRIAGIKMQRYGNIPLKFVVIILSIIAFLSLICPYKMWGRIKGLGVILKIPFEILCIMLFFGFASGMFIQPLFYEYMNDYNSLRYLFEKLSLNGSSLDIIFITINVIYWMFLITVTFVAVIAIKNIFRMGFIRYFKERSLLGIILRKIKHASIKVIESIKSLDLNDDFEKSLIKVLGINFIILSLISMIWFFGIGAYIIYTIILFVFLRKYIKEIKEKYERLLEVTNEMAEGNLDVEIDEDLGLFNSLKNELKKVQKGFKKAVNEEVKSQRMKTDLISNVSHDLKTPLTSIITYIDLLKNKNITEEEREQYIDTLDRKSQRLKTLIEDLFEMSKASSKNVQLNIIDVDVVQLMKQTQFELNDKIEESNLVFKCNYPEEKIIVPLDSQKTFRVFENLLTNILKYSLDNSRVYIDIFKEDKKVYITLKNISSTEMNFDESEIVERFSRGDKSRNTEGSGLGLAIAKSFVELQNGTFKIEIEGDMFKVKIGFDFKDVM